MKLDVNVKSHRSLVAIVLSVCVTALGIFKIAPPEWVMGFLGVVWATYGTVTSVENRAKLKNGYGGGYINPLTDKAKKLAEEAERLAKEGK